jgi:hypothetical protein
VVVGRWNSDGTMMDVWYAPGTKVNGAFYRPADQNFYFVDGSALKSFSATDLAGNPPGGTQYTYNGSAYIPTESTNTWSTVTPTTGGSLLNVGIGGSCLTPDGDVLLAAYGSTSYDVLKYSFSTNTVTGVGSNNLMGSVYDGRYVACDSSGNIYLNDYTNEQISKYDSSGSLVKADFITVSDILGPTGVLYYNNAIYVSLRQQKKIAKYDLSGNLLATSATAATTGSLFDLNVDANGAIFVDGANGMATWDGVDGSAVTQVSGVPGYNAGNIAVTPEPATISLLVLGGASALLRRRRRNDRA